VGEGNKEKKGTGETEVITVKTIYRGRKETIEQDTEGESS
ncbi:12409_t:CDS:1, partial [Ambispora gerdemannii]